MLPYALTDAHILMLLFQVHQAVLPMLVNIDLMDASYLTFDADNLPHYQGSADPLEVLNGFNFNSSTLFANLHVVLTMIANVQVTLKYSFFSFLVISPADIYIVFCTLSCSKFLASRKIVAVCIASHHICWSYVRSPDR